MNLISSKLRLALFGLALALPLATYAAPAVDGEESEPCCFPHHRARHFDADHLPPHLRELNLSDSQRTQIGELFKTQGSGLRDKLESGKKIHHELRNLAMSAEYSEDKAKAIAENGARAMVEGALAHARLDQAIYQLLTPTQQQQLKEKMARKESHCQTK